jgi:hypothetical protein
VTVDRSTATFDLAQPALRAPDEFGRHGLAQAAAVSDVRSDDRSRRERPLCAFRQGLAGPKCVKLRENPARGHALLGARDTHRTADAGTADAAVAVGVLAVRKILLVVVLPQRDRCSSDGAA